MGAIIFFVAFLLILCIGHIIVAVLYKLITRSKLSIWQIINKL